MRSSRGKRGAVLAEFIIAFMPICAMFLCVAEFSRLLIARLAVQHAAEVAVRACAVIIAPDPGSSQNVDGTADDVTTAANMVLKPSGINPAWHGFVGEELTVSDPKCTHAGVANGGTDTVTIDASFDCKIPLARWIICGGAPKSFTMTAQFPHQGAAYKLFDQDPDVEETP